MAMGLLSATVESCWNKKMDHRCGPKTLLNNFKTNILSILFLQ